MRVWHTLILVSILLVSPYSFSQTQISKAGPIRSIDLFHELMNDPELRSVFTELQHQYLNTRADRYLLTALRLDPLLKPIYERAKQNHDLSLEQISIQLDLDSMRIDSEFIREANKLPPEEKKGIEKYIRLNTMVIQVARELGFSEKAITNREILILSGGNNAFTVSGNDDRIIVGVESGLLEKMEPKEVMAVLAHELGHIRSKHSLISMTVNIMLNTVFSHFRSQANQGLMQQKIARLGGRCYMGCSRNHFDSEFKEFLNKNDWSQENVVELSNSVATELQAQQEMMAKVTRQFLVHLVKVLEEAQSPKGTIEYFRHLAESFDKPELAKVTQSEFLKQAELAANTISRIKETSADRYAGSALPNEVIASTFMKLMGGDFKIANRKFMLVQALRQAQERINTVGPYMRELSTGSHPKLKLRVSNIMAIEKYPTLLFANRFYRLLFLQVSILEREFENSREIKEAVSAELRSQLFIEQDKLKSAQNKIGEKLISMIEDMGFDSKQNPRLRNFIEFKLLMKELEVGLKEQAGLQRSTEAKENYLLAQEDYVRINKTLSFMGQEILKKARSRLAAVKENDKLANLVREKIVSVERLLKVNTIEEAQAYRAEIRSQFKGRRFERQLPADMGLGKKKNPVAVNPVQSQVTPQVVANQLNSCRMVFAK